MTIHYFAYSKVAPSLRYRGKHLFKKIQNISNVKTKFYMPHWKSFFPFLILLYKVLLKINKEDVYIVQKICDPSGYQKLIFWIIKQSTKTIYDIDDAMYIIKDPSIIESFMKQVSHVVVASENLFNYAQKFNKNIHIITTPVPDVHNIQFERNNTIFTIGWIGMYKVHRENLFKIFFPIIKKISHPLRLSLLGLGTKKDILEITTYFADNKNIQIYAPLNIDWENEQKTQWQICSFDVGIMPLLDTEMNRGKSAFKLKQYLSCGVPTLASNIGDNKHFIIHDYNGYLCETKLAWKKYLEKIIAMPRINYINFRKSAHNSYLDSSYTLEHAAKKYLRIIKDL